MAKHKPAKMLAVLGRCHRTGRWRVGTRSSVLAVLGSCRLDMRASFVEDDEKQLKMKVTVLLGSAVFILPDGAEVRPSGLSMLSVSLVDVPENPEPCGLPTLDIEWNCVLGRVHVVTGQALAELEAAAVANAAGRRGRRRRARPASSRPASSALLADGYNAKAEGPVSSFAPTALVRPGAGSPAAPTEPVAAMAGPPATLAWADDPTGVAPDPGPAEPLSQSVPEADDQKPSGAVADDASAVEPMADDAPADDAPADDAADGASPGDGRRPGDPPAGAASDPAAARRP